MQKTTIFALPIALILCLTSLSLVAAAPSPSPSPSPSPASIDEITSNLKERLQETLSSTVSADMATSVGYIGTVKDVVSDTLVMDTKDGRKNVTTTSAIITRTPGNRVIKLDNVQIGDSVIAIGTPSAEDELAAKSILVSSSPITPPAKTSGYGVIQAIARGSLTISNPGSGDTTTISVDSDTVVKTTTALLTLKSLSVGDTLVYTADLDKNNAQTATIIMQIASAIPSPLASPEQSEGGSPSGKKK